MSRIALVIFAMVATSVMGILIVASLALGYDTQKPIIISAIIGFIVSIPASILIARKLSHLQ